MKNKFIWVLVIIIFLVFGFYFYLKTTNYSAVPVQQANMSTYRDGQYYFTFQYPSNVYITSNPDSIAWPHAVVLLRLPGSQAYDLAVEYWNNESDAQKIKPDLIKQTRGIFITFKNEGNYPSISNQNKILTEIIKSVTFTG